MSNIIVLKSAPAIAPRGKHAGVFIDTKQEAGTDKFGAAYNNIISAVEVADKSGKIHRIEKTFNLLGRGFSAFCADFKAWNLRELTQDEKEGFNPDDLLKGKAVLIIFAFSRGMLIPPKSP